MNKKNNHIIIFLMGVIIIILGVLCILFASGTINFNNKEIKVDSNNEVVNDTSKEENKKSYVGEYTFSTNNDDVPYTSIIDLESDGTFYASQTGTMKNWYYGTYEITGDKLKLNYKFSTPAVQKMGEKLNQTIEYNFENNTISGTENEYTLFASGVNANLKKNSNQLNVKSDFLNSLIDMYVMD